MISSGAFASDSFTELGVPAPLEPLAAIESSLPRHSE